MDFLSAITGGGNILNLAMNVASIAFPELALVNAASGLLNQVLGQAAQQGVQQLCQEAGLPKFIADAVGKLIQQQIPGLGQGGGDDAQNHVQDQWGGDMQKIGNDFCKEFVNNCAQHMGGS